MKRKISWKHLFSLSVSLLCSIGIIALLFAISQGSGKEQATGEIITPITIDLKNDNPDELQKVAEKGDYVLYANLSKAVIRLANTKTGDIWDSAPAGIDNNKTIKGAAKFAVSSLLSIRYANRDANVTTQNCIIGSVNKKSFNAKKIENGVRFDFYFKNEGFLVPLELTLSESGLSASIPIQDIREESNMQKLVSVLVLPGFGAAPENADGYMLVPDGSGMLVGFNRGYASYSGRIYGDDTALVKKTKTEKDSVIRLPVFGTKVNKQALAGIVTNGDARSKINAVVPTASSPYGAISTEFIYRESILVDVSQKTFEFTQVNMFENTPCRLDRYTVQYSTPEQPDYVGMANTYRAYLIDQKGMLPLKEKTNALFIEFIGGVRCQQSVLGIPVEQVVPVTSFEDAENITETLRNDGVTDLVVDYTYWAKSASDSRLTVDMAPDNALGGANKLSDFLASQKKQHTPVFLDCNLTDMVYDQPGYSTKYDSAQTVRKEPAVQYTYKMSTFHADTSAPLRFLLSPALFPKAADQTLKSAGKLDCGGLSVNSLGSKLYSDFGEKAMDRGTVQTVVEKVLGQFKARGSTLFSAANAYAFPYASCLTDVPAQSGGWQMQQTSVPFYSTALHGLVPLSSESINSNPDSQTAFLQALEGGLQLKYTLGSENTDKLTSTILENDSYISVDLWLTDAMQKYKQAAGYLSGVSNQKIVSHTVYMPGVTKTVFENGLGVYVNYTDETVTVEGRQIQPQNYLPIGW